MQFIGGGVLIDPRNFPCPRSLGIDDGSCAFGDDASVPWDMFAVRVSFGGFAIIGADEEVILELWNSGKIGNDVIVWRLMLMVI